MTVATYTKAGNKATTSAKLDKSIFGDMPKSHELLKSAYVAYLSNGRQSPAKTKTRGEVSGGGKKPWKQKGTGRARFGSSRNPIWRGGGIAFGPTGEENYTHKLHTNAKRKAIRQSLSLAADSDKITVIENIIFKDGKTAEAVKLFDKIGVSLGSVLIVVTDKTAEISRPLNNLPNVKLVQSKYLNVFDTLNADNIVITQAALEEVNAWLAPPKATVTKKGIKK
ncbi:50S ribosomal protein L4 [soil metagenome]